ncbi:MAG: YfhO family protein [Oscillospiraceae bacterium]|nr:YfhO family protein [Oscillospiraceae bacterium]
METRLNKKSRSLLLLSFLLPVILSTLCFALKEIAPFGEYSLLRSDAWAQYHPYLSQFRHLLLNGGSVEHTWNVGMGINYIPILAYYVSSPLYLLSVLVPETLLTQFMLATTIVKLGLAGLFFAIYLRHAYRRQDKVIPFFALLYALCAWSAGYYWNIMWLDVFAMLPLLLTGTLSMLREGKYRLYTIALALCLWCNYYLSYCCCLFVLLYFLGYHICKGSDWKTLLRALLRFALCTLLAVCLTAVLLIPTLMGMQNTHSAAEVSFNLLSLRLPDIEYTFSLSAFLKALVQVTSRMLPSTTPTHIDGLPNLFSGFSVLILAVYYLCCREISVRERLFNGLMLVFFVLSCIFRALDYIWHGFHFPNMLPNRFSFLFSFLLLTMGYRGYTLLHHTKLKRILPPLLFGLSLIVVGFLNRRTLSFGYYAVLLCLLVLTAVGIAFLLSGKWNIPRISPTLRSRISVVLLCLVFLGESFLSFYTGVFQGLEEDELISRAVNGYTLYETVASKDAELFYRTDYTHSGCNNDGALQHYNGVSIFSSSALVNQGNFASALGLVAWPESNSTVYMESSPLTHTFCGIKYLIGEEGSFFSPNSTPLVSSYDGHELRLAPGYIGMGFMMDGAAADFASYQDEKNPFAEQTELFRLATGIEEELYHPIYEPELSASEGCTLENTEDNTQFLYNVPADQSKGDFTLRYTMEEPGLLCLATRMLGGKKLSARKNGEELFSIHTTARGILSLGDVEVGDVIELTYTSDEFKEAGISARLAFFDSQVLQQGLDSLSDEVWNITYQDDTTVEGTIAAKADGFFYTSIPYEPGWTVLVDGEDIPVAQSYDPSNQDVKLSDALISFPLSAGQHTIRLEYHTPGLTVGMILSLCGLAVLAALLLSKKKTLFPNPAPMNKGDSL